MLELLPPRGGPGQTRADHGKLIGALACAAGVYGVALTASAQDAGQPSPPPVDTATVYRAELPEEEDTEERLRFRGSRVGIDNSVSTQTVGVGSDYQSRNPSYEFGIAVRPRYVLWQPDARRSASVAGSVALIREFTNSDTTTDYGEWTFTDAEILLGYTQELAESERYRTELTAALPLLSLPTSQASANNGKILGLGTSFALTQTLPLREGEFFSSTSLRLRVGYTYQFTKAVVPTNDTVERVTVDPLGQTVPADQLAGAAFAQHLGDLALAAGLAIAPAVHLDFDLGWRPAYKYDLGDEAVCGVVLTGCIEPEPVEDPQNWAVITVFQAEFAVDAPDPMTFSVGYQNVTNQLGPDGQRRNVFYSPDARFFATVQVRLDDLYHLVNRKPKRAEQARLAD